MQVHKIGAPPRHWRQRGAGAGRQVKQAPKLHTLRPSARPSKPLWRRVGCWSVCLTWRNGVRRSKVRFSSATEEGNLLWRPISRHWRPQSSRCGLWMFRSLLQLHPVEGGLTGRKVELRIPRAARGPGTQRWGKGSCELGLAWINHPESESWSSARQGGQAAEQLAAQSSGTMESELKTETPGDSSLPWVSRWASTSSRCIS